jgi:hypothetical protein
MSILAYCQFQKGGKTGSLLAVTNGRGEITLVCDFEVRKLHLSLAGHLSLHTNDFQIALGQAPGFLSTFHNFTVKDGLVFLTKNSTVVCIHDIFGSNPWMTMIHVGQNFRRESDPERRFYIGSLWFPNLTTATMVVVDLSGTTRVFKVNDNFEDSVLIEEKMGERPNPKFVSN